MTTEFITEEERSQSQQTQGLTTSKKITQPHCRPILIHSFIHSFTFNRRLKAHAVEYNGKNTLTVKIKS